jgi:hypothetical protein
MLKLTVVKAHVVSACHESQMLPSKPINVLGATIITGVRPMAKSSITGAGVRLRVNGSEHLLQSSRGSRSAAKLERNAAVCLLPGTELLFERDVGYNCN